MTIFEEVQEQMGMGWVDALTLLAVAVCGGALIGVLSVVLG